METSLQGGIYTAHTLGQGLALCGGHAGPGRASGVDALGRGLDWRLSLRAWRCTCLRAIVLRRGGAIGQLLRRARTCNRRSLRSCCRRRFRARRLGLIGLCAIDASLLGGWICGCGRRGGRGLLVTLGAAARQLARQLQAHVLGLGRAECVGQVFICPGGHGPALNLACGWVCSDLALGCILLGWRACGFLCGLGHGTGLLGLGGRARIHGQGSSCGQGACSWIQPHGARSRHGRRARGLQDLVVRGFDCAIGRGLRITLGLLCRAQLRHGSRAIRRSGLRHLGLAALFLLQLRHAGLEFAAHGVQACIRHRGIRLSRRARRWSSSSNVRSACNVRSGLQILLARRINGLAGLGRARTWLARRPIPRRAAAHGRARQRAQHHCRIHILGPVLSQCQVLEDLLCHRLGQLLEETFGDGPLDHLARNALDRALLQQWIRRSCGRVIGELLGNALVALGQHGLGITDAQALRHAPAGIPEARRGRARGSRRRDLARRQQTIICLLADLLCSRAGAHDALTQRAGCRRAARTHRSHPGNGRDTPRGRPARPHGAKRRSNGFGNNAGVLNRRYRFVDNPISLLDLALSFLGCVRIPAACYLPGILEPEPYGAVLVLEEFPHPPTRGNVGKSNERFWHAYGRVHKSCANIPRPPFQAARRGGRVFHDVVDLGCGFGGLPGQRGTRGRVCLVRRRALEDVIDFTHPPTLKERCGGGRTLAGGQLRRM